jgi:hypothetical protein
MRENGMKAQFIRGFIKTSAIAVCVFSCESAVAQVGAVPVAPSFSEYVQAEVQGQLSTQSGTGPYEVSNGVSTASTGYYPGEGVASLTIKSGSTDTQFAQATETWSFYVPGPDPTALPPGFTVPVVLRGTGSLYVTKAPGSLTIDDANATFYSPIFGNYYQDLSISSQNIFGVQSPANVTVNTVYSITETINGYSIITSADGRTDSVKASIDPAVVFADGYTNPYGLTIGFSPVPTPLPASAWLLLSGLVGVGAMARKRKTN